MRNQGVKRSGGLDLCLCVVSLGLVDADLQGGQGLAAVALLRADVNVARLRVGGGLAFLCRPSVVVGKVEMGSCNGWNAEGEQEGGGEGAGESDEEGTTTKQSARERKCRKKTKLIYLIYRPPTRLRPRERRPRGTERQRIDRHTRMIGDPRFIRQSEAPPPSQPAPP